ncbi:MAG: hypothetical protein ACI83W_000913 [Marinoscillum sp.]|jgi:hypothetical protein
MPGRRPIFAGLVWDVRTLLRDGLYKAILEPESQEEKKAREHKKSNKVD